MRWRFSSLPVAVGIIALGTAFAPAAKAGCGFYPGAQSKGFIQPASFILGVGHSAFDSDNDSDRPSIVGLWRVKLISEGNEALDIPNGTVLDQGFSVWHRDGTEILNSGRDPVTGNFCLGAWKQTGHNSFALSHYALNWSGLTFDSKGNLVIDPTTKGPLNTFIGPSSIREYVTVDAGKDYFEGNFRLENFDQTGKTLVTLVGKVTGQRLTPDSPSYVP